MRIKYLIFSSACLAALISDANATIVSRIDVTGNQRMDTESVRILSDVKVGDNINYETVNNVAKKLQSSGYFSSVNTAMDGNILKIKKNALVIGCIH